MAGHFEQFEIVSELTDKYNHISESVIFQIGLVVTRTMHILINGDTTIKHAIVEQGEMDYSAYNYDDVILPCIDISLDTKLYKVADNKYGLTRGG